MQPTRYFLLVLNWGIFCLLWAVAVESIAKTSDPLVTAVHYGKMCFPRLAKGCWRLLLLGEAGCNKIEGRFGTEFARKSPPGLQTLHVLSTTHEAIVKL